MSLTLKGCRSGRNPNHSKINKSIVRRNVRRVGRSPTRFGVCLGGEDRRFVAASSKCRSAAGTKRRSWSVRCRHVDNSRSRHSGRLTSITKGWTFGLWSVGGLRGWERVGYEGRSGGGKWVKGNSGSGPSFPVFTPVWSVQVIRSGMTRRPVSEEFCATPSTPVG